MTIQWVLILKNAWPIFWPTTLYSYVVCSIIGARTAISIKNDRVVIDEKIEAFIISPFYIATFFSLFTILFFYHGSIVAHEIKSHFFENVIFTGIIVFVAHLIIEVIESTIVRKNPLRILQDKDAIRLSIIYLLIILMTSFMVILTR